MLRHILKSVRYQVVEKQNGRSAANFIKNHPPFDLVLTNLYTPYRTGLELIDLIRSDERWHAVPVIVICDDEEGYGVQRAIRRGANGHISKPISLDAILDTVKNAIESTVPGTMTP